MLSSAYALWLSFLRCFPCTSRAMVQSLRCQSTQWYFSWNGQYPHIKWLHNFNLSFSSFWIPETSLLDPLWPIFTRNVRSHRAISGNGTQWGRWAMFSYAMLLTQGYIWRELRHLGQGIRLPLWYTCINVLYISLGPRCRTLYLDYWWGNFL